MAASYSGTVYHYNSSAIFPTSAGTLAFWLYPVGWGADKNYQLINTNTTAPANYVRLQKYQDGTWYCGWYAGGDYRATGAVSITNSTWHHMALTWANGGNSYFYQDTSQVASKTSITTGAVSGFYLGDLPIAAATASAYFAEVAVWSAVLDAGERAALYAGFTPPQIRPASLVAYWPLGGLIGNNATAGVLDRWANRYDLTASGTPTWVDHPRLIYPKGAA